MLELYETFEQNEFSKIFKTTDFAYRQVTIERPLRQKFDFNAENIRDLIAVFSEFDNAEEWKKFIVSFKGETYTNKKELERVWQERIHKYKLGKIQKKVYKQFIDVVCSEGDEKSEICVDEHGNPESDPDLRDYENVPYAMDIDEYFKKEVKPYVPDAWINRGIRDHKDGKIGIVGYEIPFTRYFYKYDAPRSLEVIEKDIEKIENELLDLLKHL